MICFASFFVRLWCSWRDRGQAFVANVLDKASLYRAFEGVDAVINCTPSTPLDPARSIFTDSVARDGARNVAEVAAVMGVRCLITTGFVWSQQPANDEPFDEQSPAPEPPPPALQGEEMASEAVLRAKHRMHHIRLRFGHLYSGDSELWQLIATNLHNGSVPLIGGAKNQRPLIHTDDAVDAIMCVLADMETSTYPLTSLNNNKVYHVVDNAGGAPMAYILTTMAKALGAPAPKSIMAWRAQLTITDPAMYRLIMSSCVTKNARFCSDYPEWTLRYPTWDSGLAHLVTWWKAFPQTRHLVKT